MKIVHTSGKRKRAVARATVREGTGNIRINKVKLDIFEPSFLRQKIREPLLIAGDVSNKINIDVNVYGGGISSQAAAVRLAIGRALVEWTKNAKLKEELERYDRQMLVADVRRKEPCKPNDSKARKKRQKSYR
ncbi:30S ribosomal protein S9 [Candidatus Woesearchaeota archaeon]|nr:MAG: 30S ribosomal protein S9 [Candidatus Woesearchaeota archaeon]